MKPLQIGLLVLVGALGGAVIMKFTQRVKPAPAPIVNAAPAPVAPAPVAPAPAVPVAKAEPGPVPAPPKPVEPAQPIHREKPAKATRQPVMVAQNMPPAAPAVEPQPPAPAPVEPAPVAPPPADAEPPTPAQPAAPEPADQPAPEPAPSVTLKAGLAMPVRLGESLSSDSNQVGDTFTATLDAPLTVDGFVIAERGARVEGRVVEAQKAGHLKGQSVLALELTKLNTSDGQHVVIQTETLRRESARSTGDDVGIVGAAAGIGAIIGAIAGGGTGAAIGAGAGGAAGVGGVAVTHAKALNLPSEAKLTFRLKAPVTLTERTNR